MKEILEELGKKSYLCDIKKSDNPLEIYLKFILRNGYEIPLKMIFDERFPSELPTVRIDTRKFHIPKKPHILKKGTICYLDKEGVVWSDHIAVVINLIFERVEKVLMERDEMIEFHREFNYYLGTLENHKIAFNLFRPSEKIELIPIYTTKHEPFLFLGNDSDSKTILKNMIDCEVTNFPYHAMYIPLNVEYCGRIPSEDSPWTSKEIKSIIQECLGSNLKEIAKYAENKRDYYYLLKIKLLTGQEALVGLWYKKKTKYCKKFQPIIDENAEENFDIKTIIISRFDNNTLITRGGGVFSEKKILLVGCGAIGSDLLFLISRSGIQRIDLVDYDKLYIANTYRHFLGFNNSQQGKKKVMLLKEEMELRYPLINIIAHDGEILKLIDENVIKIDDYDLIISAIGNPNIERELSRRILKSSVPAVFVWVEAYGIGGHVLVMNNGPKGCYDCLYSDELINKASFATIEDKPFTKNITGCSGTYTPYGSIDSMETALLAARKVLEVLQNKNVQNTLYSWKGNAEDFLREGFKLSDRYTSASSNTYIVDKGIFGSGCKFCRCDK